MFDVKRSTLCDHFHGKQLKKLGRPQAVVPEVEDAIATMLDQVAEWGFPVGRFKLKLIVKNILHNHCQDVMIGSTISLSEIECQSEQPQISNDHVLLLMLKSPMSFLIILRNLSRSLSQFHPEYL